MTPPEDEFVDATQPSRPAGARDARLEEFESFEALVRASYDDLLRFAVRRVGVHDAADVVADVYLAAWRRRSVVTDLDRLWLFGVATRVIANRNRGGSAAIGSWFGWPPSPPRPARTRPRPTVRTTTGIARCASPWTPWRRPNGRR